MRKKNSEILLEVYMRDHLVGRIRLDERRRFAFQYDPSWLTYDYATPLSLSLPLSEKPYLDDTARPFFSNLLPEAEIRRILARRLGISEQRDFLCFNAESRSAARILIDQNGSSYMEVQNLGR